MEYLLRTNQLTKQYKNFKALDRLNMNVPKGAIYGFVGKNGAGKTTLIRIITGLQHPTSGDFSLFGIPNESKEFEKTQRKLGAVIETPSLYLEMTARENLWQQLTLLGCPDEEEIEHLLEVVGLKDTGKKKVKNFSLGMKQRLGIAIALAGNPDFLVLDEPINGLDPEGIIEIRELILKLNREQRITVLISSHILDEMSRLATHYGFIHQGHLLKEMTADELEALCRKCTHVEVTDTKAMASVLERWNVEYKILSDTEVDIYEKVNVTELVTALLKENCEVITIENREESLESYYIRLIGGDCNE